MSTVLSQSPTAAHPDRPSENGVGLLATLLPGDQGAMIAHDLGVTHSVTHMRFTFNPLGVSGGQLVLLVCMNDQGGEMMRISYHTATRQLDVWALGSTRASTTLDGVIPWQCVEVAVDAANDHLELWINGVSAEEVNSGLSSWSMQTCWFGVIQKQSDVTGELYLDEFCMADGYIGPVLAEPKASHAGDPARWLVVYNKGASGGVEWADAYRQARGIPFANMLGISLSTHEWDDAFGYEHLASVIQDYLEQTGLDGQVMGILTGLAVPGYIDFQSNGVLDAVPSLLQSDALSAGEIPNPNASTPIEQRLNFSDLAGVRMTARIDGIDWVAASQFITKATSVMAEPVQADDSIVYFDPFVGDEPTYQQAFTEMLDWAIGLGGMRTRLPILLSGDPTGNDDADFASVTSDGFFWGWQSTLAFPFIFDAPAGRRVVSVQVHLENPTATTIRLHEHENWIDYPLEQGYAAAIGSSRANAVAAIPSAGRFFDALRMGWTLGEAWHLAQPMLRTGFYLVGDPLMTVAMPKSGVELYGPLDSLEDLDSASPCRVLGDAVSEVDFTDELPTEGESKHYVIRRSDDRGRLEASLTSVRVINTGGVLHPSLRAPLWPDVEAWPAMVEDEQVRLSAYWLDRLDTSYIQTIELMQQPTGQALTVVATAEFQPHDRSVSIMLPIPAIKTRYRWRLTSISGEVVYSMTSDWIEPSSTPTRVLQTIGA